MSGKNDETAAIAFREMVDKVNATVLELRDELAQKSERLISMRTVIVQKDAMLVVKEARIKELEQELEQAILRPKTRVKK